MSVEITPPRADGEPLVVVVRWFQPMGVFGLVASTVMLLPAAVFAYAGQDMAILAVPLAVPGLVSLWWALAVLLNRSTISLGRTFSVRHHPIPWGHSTTSSLERVGGFELRQVRHVRRRRLQIRYDAVVIAWGEPRRLVPGISDHSQLERVVQTLQRELERLRAAEPAPTPAARTPVAAAQSKTSPPASLVGALDRMRELGARDVATLAPLVEALRTHVAAPFSVRVDALAESYEIGARLLAPGKPVLEALHTGQRPTDFRARIWKSHWDQANVLLLACAEPRVHLGLRAGAKEPVLAVEAAMLPCKPMVAVMHQPRLESAIWPALEVALAELGPEVTAIEARLAPPALLVSTFWVPYAPGTLDRAAAKLGVPDARRREIGEALEHGLRPTRVGVRASLDKVHAELHVQMTGATPAVRAVAQRLGASDARLALLDGAPEATVAVVWGANAPTHVALERTIG